MSREQRNHQTNLNCKAAARRRNAKVTFFKRFTTTAAAVLLIMICSFGFGSFFSSAHDNLENDPIDIKYYKSVQIESGDSVWSIAEEYMSDEYDSIYDYMDELVCLNQMDSSKLDELQEGDYLMVSYYDTAQ